MEQRRSHRYCLNFPLEITSAGTAGITCAGRTLEISSAGVLFESAADLKPGERIEFVITLTPSGAQSVSSQTSGADVHLRCLGKVLRTQRRQQADPTFDVAVSIDRYQFVRVPRFETAAATV